MTSNHTDKVFKEIVSGKYRDCYVVYARRSTDDPDIQKNSIKYQQAENARAQKPDLRRSAHSITSSARAVQPTNPQSCALKRP